MGRGGCLGTFIVVAVCWAFWLGTFIVVAVCWAFWLGLIIIQEIIIRVLRLRLSKDVDSVISFILLGVAIYVVYRVRQNELRKQ